MEVLFVSHKFPPSTGGMEKQSYELVTRFEKKGKVHRLVYEKKGSVVFFFLFLYSRIKQICRENPNIKIIHFNDALIASFCIFLPKKNGIKYVVTLHGLDVVFPSSIYHQSIFKRLIRFDHFIAVSRATATKAIELGIPSAKVSVIPNGVSTEEAPTHPGETYQNWLESKGIASSNQTTLMMLGRAVSRKGFSWFSNEVMPLLGGDFCLYMAGPFRFEPSFQERLIYLLPTTFQQKLMLFLGYASDEREIRKALKINPNIHHFGRVSFDEKNMLLQHADAFLMPNIHVEGDMEGFGLVCLEAAINKTLVFAADTEGIPDAIQDHKNGFLLPSENADVWAERLRHFAVNKALYKAQKDNFSNFTKENYNWEKMVDAYFIRFEEIIKMEN